MSDPRPANPSNPWAILLVAGIITGLIAGIGFGYLLFKSNSTATGPTRPTATPGYTPTPTVSLGPTLTPPPPTAAPTPVPTPAPPPASGGITDSSFSGCPATAPGQHPLAPVTGPTATGAAADPANDWYGCGDALTPTGFVTGNNWEEAVSFTCPDSDGPGMSTGLSVQAWVYEGGGTPVHNTADDNDLALPWTDNAHTLESQGGNFRLRMVQESGAAGDLRCRWHVRAYTVGP